MKVLVFEYIMGGGLAKQTLTDSLLNEGVLMLTTLINELAINPALQLTVLLDWRCKSIDLPECAEKVIIHNNQPFMDVLSALIDDHDMVWPIAPEHSDVLYNVSLLVESKARRLLNSSSKAVALCGDKLQMWRLLKKKGIKTVNTLGLDRYRQEFNYPLVIKPKDGVGCINTYLVSNVKEFSRINELVVDQSDYIVQPYIIGQPMSLSCLFHNGRAYLLCCNHQDISTEQGQFELIACEVNANSSNQQSYQRLIDQLAVDITGLWGYVGIDIIQSESGQLFVVEINPRLTTSYAGINSALGINVANIVLGLLDNKTDFIKKKNKPITVAV